MYFDAHKIIAEGGNCKTRGGYPARIYEYRPEKKNKQLLVSIKFRNDKTYDDSYNSTYGDSVAKEYHISGRLHGDMGKCDLDLVPLSYTKDDYEKDDGWKIIKIEIDCNECSEKSDITKEVYQYCLENNIDFYNEYHTATDKVNNVCYYCQQKKTHNEVVQRNLEDLWDYRYRIEYRLEVINNYIKCFFHEKSKSNKSTCMHNYIYAFDLEQSRHWSNGREAIGMFCMHCGKIHEMSFIEKYDE